MTNYFIFQQMNNVLDLKTNKVHKCKMTDGFLSLCNDAPTDIIEMLDNKEFVDALTDEEVIFLTEKYL